MPGDQKVILVGDAGVGKTCMVMRLSQSEINEVHITTIGADLKAVQIGVDGSTVDLQIWDTAGDQRYRSLMPMYFRNSRFVVFVYSVTERATFDGIQQWSEIVTANIPAPLPLLYLVGNKTDLEPLRTVPFDDGMKRAAQIHATFFEVSAKSGYNIVELFQHIARTVITKSPPLEMARLELSEESKSGAQRAAGGSNRTCCSS